MSVTGGIPRRRLGRTGEMVSAIGVGGSHLGIDGVDEALAIRIVRSAIDRGITFMDNSWDYNDGKSERRMGKALQNGYRDQVFLMTKIDGRSKKEATKQLEGRQDQVHRIHGPQGSASSSPHARGRQRE